MLHIQSLSLVISLFAYLVEGNLETFAGCLTQNGIQSKNYVVKGKSKTYKHLNYQYNKFPPKVYPPAYVLVTSEAEVVAVVTCAQMESVKLVVKSGGHSYEKYSYGDGATTVVLDVRKLNKILLAGNTASIGPGATSGAISYGLWAQGKAYMPTGQCPSVGISGFATSGGYGTFSAKFGLAIDFLKSICLVTANGSVILTNRKRNSDLFWALRGGGGGSFGVITNLKFKVVPAADTVSFWRVTYVMYRFVETFATWQDIVACNCSVAESYYSITQANEIEILLWVWNAHGINEIQKRFSPDQKSSEIKTVPYHDFLLIMATNISGAMARKGISLQTPEDLKNYPIGNDAPIAYKLKSFYLTRKLKTCELTQLEVLLQSKPPSAYVFFEAAGGAVGDIKDDATAFVHRRGRFAIAAAPVSTAAPGLAFLLGRIWQQKFFEFGSDVLGEGETYQNLVDAELGVKYLKRYYGSNLQRLVAIKKKYDPRNFFNFPQSIPTDL